MIARLYSLLTVTGDAARLMPPIKSDRKEALKQLESARVHAAENLQIIWEVKNSSGVARSRPDITAAIVIVERGVLNIYVNSADIQSGQLPPEVAEVLSHWYGIQNTVLLWLILTCGAENIEHQLGRRGIPNLAERTYLEDFGKELIFYMCLASQ
jgi:hypothetical protein